MFTIKDIENKVRELAAASPDCVYTRTTGASVGCSNVGGECSNGTKGCIVGQALQALGVPRELLAANDYGFGVNTMMPPLRKTGHLAGANACNENDEVKSREWVRSVQCKQDKGTTWGDAVAQADNYFATV